MLKKTGQLKDYIVYGSGQVLNLIAPLVVAPHIIIVCGIENWGRIGVALSVFALLGIFIDFGSLLFGVKELSINKGDNAKIKKQLEEVYTFRTIVFLVVLVLLLLSFLFFRIDYKLYLCGIAMLAAQLLNPLWIYQAFEEFTIINRIILVSKALYVIGVYVFIKTPQAYPFMLLYLGGANTIVYGYFLLKLGKKYNLALFHVPAKTLKENFKKEYPIVISNFSITAYTWGPILIVGYVGGEYLAGLYHIGDMLLKIIRSYLSVFFNVSFPKFCKSYNENKHKGMVFLKKLNKYHLLLMGLGITMVYIVVPLFIDSFSLSEEYYDKVFFCMKFLGLGIIIALNIPFYQLLIYYNKQKQVSGISTIGAVIMLLTCYFLTRKFNLSGSVVSLYIVECFITSSIIIVYFKSVFKKELHS
ncbi:oligosaccharide flippase family protein [Flavobacterium sp. NRK1]|uniref:oligosaccharide flippase family protein n=1 Tax=Flavobacterium sp. NRK1 TaxID=2954929 RepID=UPI0020925E6B|nr:oligosaccharide flippase family protein [Flavobacterium sp. NRK1]MCO6147650.1 oligosaccharide flippase family protein [Flavobacterium sp. NRK1]